MSQWAAAQSTNAMRVEVAALAFGIVSESGEMAGGDAKRLSALIHLETLDRTQMETALRLGGDCNESEQERCDGAMWSASRGCCNEHGRPAVTGHALM